MLFVVIFFLNTEESMEIQTTIYYFISEYFSLNTSAFIIF